MLDCRPKRHHYSIFDLLYIKRIIKVMERGIKVRLMDLAKRINERMVSNTYENLDIPSDLDSRLHRDWQRASYTAKAVIINTSVINEQSAYEDSFAIGDLVTGFIAADSFTKRSKLTDIDRDELLASLYKVAEKRALEHAQIGQKIMTPEAQQKYLKLAKSIARTLIPEKQIEFNTDPENISMVLGMMERTRQDLANPLPQTEPSDKIVTFKPR